MYKAFRAMHGIWCYIRGTFTMRIMKLKLNLLIYCLSYRRPYLLRCTIEFLYTKYILFIKRSQNCINLMPHITGTCHWSYLLFLLSGLNDSRQNNKNCKGPEVGRKSSKGIVTGGDSVQDKEAKWQGETQGDHLGRS